MTQISRRRYLKYVGAGAVAAAAAAAGLYYTSIPGPSPSSTTTSAPTSTTAATMTSLALNVLTSSDQHFFLWDKDTPIAPGGLLAQYEKLTGVSVKPERLDWTAQLEKSRLELSSKSPTYDVVDYDAYVRGSYLPNDWFVDYLELEKKTGLEMGFDDIFPKVVQDCGTYKGKILGIPSVGAVSPYFVYRKSLFQDSKNQDEFDKKYGHPLGPPKNWDEVNEIAEFFTRDGWSGISLLLAAEAGSDEFYFRWLNMGGGKDGTHETMGIVDDKFQPLINNDIGVKALSHIVEIHKNNWCAPGGTEVSWTDMANNYFAGSVAMAYGWNNAFSGVDDPKVSKAAEDNGWWAMPLPSDGVNCHSSLMLAINKFGNDIEESYKFVRWLYSPENDKKLALMGLCGPIRLSTYKDPDITGDPFLGPMDNGLYQLFQTPSRPQPNLPEFGEMNYELSIEIQKAALGTKTVRQALDDAVKKWREILEKAGYYK